MIETGRKEKKKRRRRKDLMMIEDFSFHWGDFQKRKLDVFVCFFQTCDFVWLFLPFVFIFDHQENHFDGEDSAGDAAGDDEEEDASPFVRVFEHFAAKTE